MAKTQSEETRVKRGDAQVMALFDPSQALNGPEPLRAQATRLTRILTISASPPPRSCRFASY